MTRNSSIWMFLIGVFFCVLAMNNCYAEDVPVCRHKWGTSDFSDWEWFVEQEEDNQKSHWLAHYGAQEICSICGEFNGYNRVSAAGQTHVFDVIRCTPLEGDSIEILFRCRMCEYERCEKTTVQTIVDGTSGSCLLGGECSQNVVGYMNDDGLILPNSMVGELANFDIGEREWFISIIYDPANQTFLLASRDYCPVCGRPRFFSHSDATQIFNERWNGFPIMTEEYFLTVDMPNNLPYQLIDQLREEAQAS